LRGQAMRDGAWFPLGDGFEVKLRSTRAEEVREAIESAVNRRRKALGIRQGRELPTREVEEAVVGVIFGRILIDWRGLKENGQPVPCTLENFQRASEDDPTFADRLLRLAGDDYEYGAESLEVVEGD